MAGTELGVLNISISHCFRDLSCSTSIRYEAFIDSSVLEEAVQAWKQTGKKGCFPVDIYVYGSRDAMEPVSKVFSRAKLYFQHPYHRDGSSMYENPHYLSFSNIATSESPSLTRWSTSIHQSEKPSHCTISDVLKDLDQKGSICPANIDFRVRTPLLRFVFPACKIHLSSNSLTNTLQPSERRCHFCTATRGRVYSAFSVTLDIPPANINPLLVSFSLYHILAAARGNTTPCLNANQHWQVVLNIWLQVLNEKAFPILTWAASFPMRWGWERPWRCCLLF